MNSDIRKKKAKKVLFKLMNNAVFEKTVKNLRNTNF